MVEDTVLETAMDVFIRYGYRKTSMEDVAAAVGVSRQAIYKRYGTKDALFKAVVDASVTQFFEAARQPLCEPGVSARERILRSCVCSAGAFVERMRSSPHSYEVIAVADTEASDILEEQDTAFRQSLIALLLAEGIFTDHAAATDAVDVLQFASKGLFHDAKTKKDYCEGMRVVVRTLIPDDST